jgi:hypothetical protein
MDCGLVERAVQCAVRCVCGTLCAAVESVSRLRHFHSIFENILMHVNCAGYVCMQRGRGPGADLSLLSVGSALFVFRYMAKIVSF